MQKRNAVEHVVGMGKGSHHRACRVMGLARSSAYYRAKPGAEKLRKEGLIEEISREHPVYGYRKVTELLRQSGEKMNGKRVARVRRERGLQASRRPGKRRRASPASSKRQRSSRPNEVWSYDFVEDVTTKGRRLRILSVIDEYTRECLFLRAAPSYPARRVLDALEEILVCSGRKPENIRSDNGPEFVATRVRQWAEAGQVGLCYIKPGSPWENGNVESFHASLRAELLDRELFFSVAEANVMLTDWREEYNFKRPHGSLGYQTPAAAAQQELALRATPCAPVPAGHPSLN
jgi:putative transposase